jgi:hypothetical protein
MGSGGRRGKPAILFALCLTVVSASCLTQTPIATAQSHARGVDVTPRSFARHRPQGNRSRVNSDSAHAAIAGGTGLEIQNAPWQVAVLEGVQEICGGSIIDLTHILTAAECVVGPEGAPLPPSALDVIAGISSLQETSATAEAGAVSSVRVHPYYHAPSRADDIAVLTLASPLTANAGVESIGMAPAGFSPPEGTAANLAGFGAESPEEHSGKLFSLKFKVGFSHECGGEADALFVCGSAALGSACTGDMGDGLTSIESTPELVGVSDEIQPVAGKLCGDGAINGFANVVAPEIRDFIEGSESPPQAPRGAGAVIKGVLEVGEALMCEPGSWSNGPTFSYTFASVANREVLQSGESPTYALSSANVGESILCEVRASNAGGSGVGRTPGVGPVMEASSLTGEGTIIGANAIESLPFNEKTLEEFFAHAAFGEPRAATVPAVAPGSVISEVRTDGASIVVRGVGVASVRLECRGSAPCHGKIALLERRTAKIDGRKTTRTASIGAATFTLAGGHLGTVKIKLGAVGRASLAAARGRLSARLSILGLQTNPTHVQIESVRLVQQQHPALVRKGSGS